MDATHDGGSDRSSRDQAMLDRPVDGAEDSRESAPDASPTQPLPDAEADMATQPLADDHTIPIEATQPFPALAEPTPDDTLAPTSFADVRTTARAWLAGRAARLSQLANAHPYLGVVATLILIGLVCAAVYLGTQVTLLPSDAAIASDATERLVAPTYTAGSFVPEEPLELRTVEVEEKHRGEAADTCEAQVVASYANSRMETRANAQLAYTHGSEGWSCASASVTNVAHHATAGVDQQLVLEQIETLLQAAEPPDDDRESLVSLYRNATVTVTDNRFDEEAQTDQLFLHLATTGAFVSYQCDLIAQFAFAPASGAWELSRVLASNGAKDLSFEPLVGTWQGTFQSQDSGVNPGKCLASRERGLTITITQASLNPDGSTTIKGTLSGVAHLHPYTNKDVDSSEEDLQLDEVPFASATPLEQLENGTFLPYTVSYGSEPAGIVFECATQDLSGGVVTLTLTFGSASDPSLATATLTSSHTYQDTFLFVVPYERQARYTDSFTLEKTSE